MKIIYVKSKEKLLYSKRLIKPFKMFCLAYFNVNDKYLELIWCRPFSEFNNRYSIEVKHW